MCMRRLIEEGADITALTNEGKSPVTLAEEMKCSLVFARALQDSGRYNEDLTPRVKPRFSQDLAKKIMFCSPFVSPPSGLCPFPSPAFDTLLSVILCSRLTAVLNLDCIGDVFDVTVLFVVVDGDSLALQRECRCAGICCQGLTWCLGTNS